MSMKFLKTIAPAALRELWEKVSGNIVPKDTSAEVGIGTDDPDTKLHVEGAVAANGGVATTIQNTGTGYSWLTLQSDSNQYDILVGGSGTSATDNGTLIVADGVNVRMVIDSAGNVGIGTNDPDEKLHVNTTSGGHSYIKAEIGATATYQSALQLKTGNTDWYIGNTGGADDLWFYSGTNTAQRMKINGPTGAVTVNAGNLVIGTAGTGIDFSAPTPASGMTAELLDHYEEGTWTGVFSDGTNNGTMSASYTTGTYTRVGNMVTVTGHFILSSLGSMDGNVRLTGLPFTVFNAARTYASVSIEYAEGLSITAGQALGGYAAINSTRLDINLWDATTGTSPLQAISELTADGGIILTCSYMVS